MASLTFQKDAAIFQIDVDPLTGTFVVGEFFVDTVDPTKLAEVIAFTDDLDGTGTLDYILVGTSATQFIDTDTFTGDGSGTGTVNGAPTNNGTHDAHVIQVDIPFVRVTIQDLINQIREYEDELINMDHPKIIDASGKQDLGGGVLVGITLEMLDNWRVQFEPRTGPLLESVSVTGGNIVTTNDFNNNPIKPSPFTQVSVTSSSSATISQIEIIDLVHRIESLRDHATFGKIIYWNPIIGDDEFLGESPDTATKTFAAAHAIATAGDGDVIFALNKGATGNVMVNEQLVITKASLSLRGPGKSFHIHNMNGTGVSISVTATNVVLENFTIEHDAGAINMTDGIVADGSSGNVDNLLLKNILFLNVNNDSIAINDSEHSLIESCFIENTGGNGIYVGNGVRDLKIVNNTIDRPVNGVNLDGDALDTALINNEIHDCSNYGIRIGATANETIIRKDNFLFDNAAGNIEEVAGSTNTTIEALEDHQLLFGGAIHVDQNSGISGTEFPSGMATNPVNNLTDAMVIAANNFLEEIHLHIGTFVITGSFDFDQFRLRGEGAARSRLVFADGVATTDNTVFEDLFVGGIMNGDGMLCRNCAVGSADSLPLSAFDGSLTGCAIVGNILHKADGGEDSVALLDCYTVGNQIPTIDCNGDKALTLSNYSGQVKIDGLTGTDGIKFLRIGMLHGDVELLAGNTGTNPILVEGMGNVTDNSSLALDDSNLISTIIQDNNDDPSIFV